MRPAPRRKKLPARYSDAEEEHGSGGNLFLWTVIILLLTGFAIACWIGSFYVFGHPEKPFSYSVLTKLKKLDPPKRFELTAAPRGEFLRPQQLFDRYSKMTPRELERTNETLLRNYLRNFKLSQDLVPYVVGTYNILDSYELTANDFFTSGVVAVAQSKDNPNVLLEQIFTADEKVIPALHRTLLTGLDIDLKRENELAAVIGVERLGDGKIKVTAISILYPSYESATSSGTFTLEPPAGMNVAAGLPVVRTDRLREAGDKYASFLRRAGLTPGNATADVSQSRLMRVERPVAVNLPVQPAIPPSTPEPTPTPEMTVARAEPVTPTSVPPVLPEDAPVRPAIPVTEAAPSPNEPPTAPAVPAAPVTAESTPPPPLATPAPTPPSPSPSPAAAIAATTAGSWPVYAPGQMPRGRLFNVKDIPAVADQVGSERTYLQGSFVVTASGSNRAVLRSQGGLTESLGLGNRPSNVRVIVEFPAGSKPPSEGATFSRDSRRPFQITEVRTGADGQVNVYVREVTRP